MIDPSIIFSSIDEAADLADLKKRLSERGIECQFVKAPGAQQPTGWLLRQAGPAGTWIKGSEVSRELSLRKVQERIRQRQAAANRKALGDLLDDVDEAFRSRLDLEAAELGEEYRVSVMKRQKGLAALLLQLPVHAVRVAICGLVNFLIRLVERVFGLLPESLGRLHAPKFENMVDVPVGVVPPAPPRPDADTSELKRRALALKAVDSVLDQACTAIEQRKPGQMPGLMVKDAEVQVARDKVFEAIEESYRQVEEEDDQDSEPQYERERPR